MYKADIRIDETILTEERKLQNNGGFKPLPIRKKGFHRALKRGESWAKFKRIDQLSTNIGYELSKLLYGFYEQEKEIKIIGLRTLLDNDSQ